LRCLFTSDLHGQQLRYDLLFDVATTRMPDAVLLGGDLFDCLPRFPPSAADMAAEMEKSFKKLLTDKIQAFRRDVREDTKFFTIMGNDDPRCYEPTLIEADQKGLITYVHSRTVPFGGMYVAGYSNVPLSPFRFKDWEKYDVPGYLSPGAIPPEDGLRTILPRSDDNMTIADDLKELELTMPHTDRTICLFHAPPYGGKLDVNYGSVHVGSIAILQFITRTQPLITLHGHIHESPDVTGFWKEQIRKTLSVNGANNTQYLTLVEFDTNRPEEAKRELVTAAGAWRHD